MIWLEGSIKLVSGLALCIMYPIRSLQPVGKVILSPILQMRKQVQGGYASNGVFLTVEPKPGDCLEYNSKFHTVMAFLTDF